MTRNKLTIHDVANAEAARIILADSVQYDGLMLQWAQTLIAKQVAGKSADGKCELLPQAERRPDFKTSLQSTRCPGHCSRCRVPLTGRTAHLPVLRVGTYCDRCCPVFRQDEGFELFEMEEANETQ